MPSPSSRIDPCGGETIVTTGSVSSTDTAGASRPTRFDGGRRLAGGRQHADGQGRRDEERSMALALYHVGGICRTGVRRAPGEGR